MPRGRGTPTASCCGWRRGGGGSEFPEFTSDGVEYLFRDTFTDADTTGVVNGNASLGNGLGYRNIVTSAFDITSNRLNSDDAFPIIKYSPSSAHSGWNRQGGRTLVALVTLSDSAGELGISLSNSPTTIDGFTFYIKSKTCYVRTPDLGAVKVYQEQDNPAKAIRYLMGITLNKDQGAIFWISSLETYDPSFDWSLPK